MSEAPKKIWMMENPQAWATRDDMFNTPYIRADLVNELVEALELAMPIIERVRFIQDAAYGNNFNKHRAERARLAHDKARAALAKLEKTHD